MKYPTEDLIDLVSDLIGLKNLSKATTLDMIIELEPIQSQTEYIKHIKANINVIGLEYLPAYQRFIKLTRDYMKIEAEHMNAERLAKMSSAAERLALKVKEIDTMVLNNQASDPQWHHFKLSTGEQYFSEKETKALSSIGGPLACVRLQRKISGRDLLAERLEEIFIERVVAPQLEVLQNNVASLVQNLAEGARA